jgi:lysophospholipase L1-like esterase
MCAAIHSNAAPAADNCDEIDKLATTTPAPPFNENRWRLYRQELASITRVDVDAVLLGDSLAELWNTKMWEPHNVLNLGVGGDDTQHVLWRLSFPKLATLKPVNLLIILGTNNLGGAKACAISFGLKRVIERVAKLWPSARITYLEITPRGNGFTDKNDVRVSVNASVRQFSGIKTVNVDEAITCGWRQPCENYADDNLHFTEAGYGVLLRAIQPILFGK